MVQVQFLRGYVPFPGVGHIYVDLPHAVNYGSKLQWFISDTLVSVVLSVLNEYSSVGDQVCEGFSDLL